MTKTRFTARVEVEPSLILLSGTGLAAGAGSGGETPAAHSAATVMAGQLRPRGLLPYGPLLRRSSSLISSAGRCGGGAGMPMAAERAMAERRWRFVSVFRRKHAGTP